MVFDQSKMVESSTKIDIDQISRYFENSLSNETDQSVRTGDYILAFREINKFFDQLGSIFIFVKDDIESKCAILEKYCLGRNGEVYRTISSMVTFEISHGLISAKDIKLERALSKTKCSEISAKEDKAEIQKEKVTDACNNLPSGSRSLLRLHRAMDFIVSLFPTLLNSDPNQSSSIKSGIRKLYDDTLAKFHPWIVRKAVHLALLTACPSREKLLSLVHYDGTMDDLRTRCQRLTRSSEHVMQNVHKTYETHGILDLP